MYDMRRLGQVTAGGGESALPVPSVRPLTRYQTVTKALVIIRDRYYECSYLKRLGTERILPITVIASNI